mmetsp:Transcript_52877/g.88111  ORF Transcript_52877/g.88111 Transcript_52877/m.88111 type:complete len:129 (+) Transcript_52877:29-415(+)|eukprot:CAMPEP_0174295206 /NCGR_PEP_ID=MMETSP0809-20121228/44015_1 /TAXON_ID=73025 ORGANISM="Eutreptiella gymnastica-like, Strain CCMP1594" /NCGR_SAMPLE_ID=MMETSP0809 /ASSEMBLY_ACC=CAM_ASM_000658 /LENGTH=128 /DNA_ID=CAMNT_0015397295 /DNA_START=44 /DNA_END=430 /DNA_ORIENTATION=-
MGGGTYEPQYPKNFFKKDAGNEITKGMPKILELGDFFSSYGSAEKTRPKNGTFYFNRANGSPTMFGPSYYNMLNFARVGKMGKYVLWVGIPLIVWRTWMKNQGIGMEYDLDQENLNPFHAKKNPAHGH